MKKFKEIFNEKDINYPFVDSIEYFFVLGSTDIYTLRNIDFYALKQYLYENDIDTITIHCNGKEKKYNVSQLDYKFYYDSYIHKVTNHYIFWNENCGVYIDIESYGIVAGHKEFLNFMMREIGKQELRERYSEFIMEWKAWKKDNWAFHLLNKENIIDI